MHHIHSSLALALYLLVCVCAAATVERSDADKLLLEANEGVNSAMRRINEVSGKLEDAVSDFKKASDTVLGNSAAFKGNAEKSTKGYSDAKKVYSILEKALETASTHSTNGTSQATKGKDGLTSATKKVEEAMKYVAAAQKEESTNGDYSQRKEKADQAKTTAETALKEAEAVTGIISAIATIKEKLIAASNEAKIALYRIRAIAADQETKVSLKATNGAVVVAVGTKGSTDAAVERIEKLLIESPEGIREAIMLKLLSAREFQKATTKDISKTQAAEIAIKLLLSTTEAAVATLASTKVMTDAEAAASSAEKAERDADSGRLNAEAALKSATRHSSYVTNVRNEVERIVKSVIEEEKANSKDSAKAPLKQTNSKLKLVDDVVPANGVAGKMAHSADGAFHSAWATYTVTALMALTAMCASV